MSASRRLGFAMRDGVVIGTLLAGTLIAIWYVGWKLAGFPFLPFDLFDWTARELPGAVVTPAIEFLVALTGRLHVTNVGAAGKQIEQVLALAEAALVIVGATTILFVSLIYSDEPALLLGVIAGGAFGLLAVMVERTFQRNEFGVPAVAVWIGGTSVLWGGAVGWIHDHLKSPPEESLAPGSAVHSRRRFLQRVTVATAGPSVMTALWAVTFGTRRANPAGAPWSSDHELPNAGDPVQVVPGTRRELTRIEDHYRIDVDTGVPAIDGARWRLRMGGLVDHPMDLTLADLRRDPALDQFVTLSCVSNPIGGDLIGTTRWTGVSLQQIVRRMSPESRATHLRVRSADGFFEVISLEAISRDSRVMLAYAWDGLPLPPEHGFPLRLFVPDLYGMKQPKWIVAIEAIDRWEPGYWVERGWDREGRVVATSVVDTVRAGHGDDRGQRTASAGGIAYAGARGVSKVEVRVDDGDWSEAQLRAPLSETAWVIWRADLPWRAGEHTVSVRCAEREGTPQGSGYHVRAVNL